MQTEVQLGRDKAESIASKLAEVETNIEYLRDFQKQASEELQMTLEDMNGKMLKKAELVAQREDLDQMYESGKNLASASGQEFAIFIKLKELAKTNGKIDSKFIEHEYQVTKAQSFFNEVIMQLKGLESEEDRLSAIESLQENVKQKACILEPQEIIRTVVNLTKELGIALDEAMLQHRFENYSNEKDKSFEERYRKLNVIMDEIRKYDYQIKSHSNQIQNILMPQSYAINLTFNETKDKLAKLQHALTVLADKKQKVDAEVEGMQARLRMSNQMHLQKESQKKLRQRLMDIEAEVQRCKAKE